jgi:hypothetical protein
MKLHYFVRFLFFFLLSTITFTCAFLPMDPEEDNEEKYRPLIRCVACENMVKRFIRKMNTTHSRLGASVKSGRFQPKSSEETKLKKATIAAWANELVDSKHLCPHNAPTKEDKEDPNMNPDAVHGPKSRIYCEQSLEASEDMLIKLAIQRKTANTIKSIDVNDTAETICANAKYCTFRTEMKTQMQNAQDEARKKFLESMPMWKLVMLEFEKNMWWYIGLFVGTIVIMSVIMIGYQYWKIKRRILERQRQIDLMKLKRQQQQYQNHKQKESSTDDDEEESEEEENESTKKKME